MKVIVLGAGVVGATTALVLAERGVDVVLIEREREAAAGTSHANGSGLTPCHAEPWNPPGTFAKLPDALLHDDRPWRMRLSALPGMFGWGLKFLANSRASRYYRNAAHCVRLGLYSTACMGPLRERHALEYRQITRGSLELYFSAEELEAAIELRRRLKLPGDLPGIDYRQLDRAELVAAEPALEPVAGRIHGTLLFPVHESGDACEFSREAVARAAGLGAEVRFGTPVERIVADSGRFRAVTTGSGEIEADACIVATGCDSPALLRPLGLRVPIYPVKGYSATIEIDADDPAPTLPLLDLKRRFVTARLGPNRLRIAGLAEFAGRDLSIDPRRLRLLLENAAALLPRLRTKILEADPHAWTGLRPMTPDGPPLIGPTPIEGLHLNTGHGAMGWTQAAGSADLVADLVTGRTPGIDPSGLLPKRCLG